MYSMNPLYNNKAMGFNRYLVRKDLETMCGDVEELLGLRDKFSFDLDQQYYHGWHGGFHQPEIIDYSYRYRYNYNNFIDYMDSHQLWEVGVLYPFCHKLTTNWYAWSIDVLCWDGYEYWRTTFMDMSSGQSPSDDPQYAMKMWSADADQWDSPYIQSQPMYVRYKTANDLTTQEGIRPGSGTRNFMWHHWNQLVYYIYSLKKDPNYMDSDWVKYGGYNARDMAIDYNMIMAPTAPGSRIQDLEVTRLLAIPTEIPELTATRFNSLLAQLPWHSWSWKTRHRPAWLNDTRFAMIPNYPYPVNPAVGWIGEERVKGKATAVNPDICYAHYIAELGAVANFIKKVYDGEADDIIKPMTANAWLVLGYSAPLKAKQIKYLNTDTLMNLGIISTAKTGIAAPAQISNYITHSIVATSNAARAKKMDTDFMDFILRINTNLRAKRKREFEVDFLATVGFSDTFRKSPSIRLANDPVVGNLAFNARLLHEPALWCETDLYPTLDLTANSVLLPSRNFDIAEYSRLRLRANLFATTGGLIATMPATNSIDALLTLTTAWIYPHFIDIQLTQLMVEQEYDVVQEGRVLTLF